MLKITRLFSWTLNVHTTLIIWVVDGHLRLNISKCGSLIFILNLFPYISVNTEWLFLFLLLIPKCWSHPWWICLIFSQSTYHPPKDLYVFTLKSCGCWQLFIFFVVVVAVIFVQFIVILDSLTAFVSNIPIYQFFPLYIFLMY